MLKFTLVNAKGSKREINSTSVRGAKNQASRHLSVQDKDVKLYDSSGKLLSSRLYFKNLTKMGWDDWVDA